MAEKIKFNDMDIKIDDIKIGSEEQKAWKMIKDDTEKRMKNLKREVEIHEQILKFATDREREEKEKFEKI